MNHDLLRQLGILIISSFSKFLTQKFSRTLQYMFLSRSECSLHLNFVNTGWFVCHDHPGPMDDIGNEGD